MKKYLYIILLCFPMIVSADIDVYLSSEKKPFHIDTWTSNTHVPDSYIRIDYKQAREDIPLSYVVSISEIQERILFILSDYTHEEQIDILQVLLDKNHSNFLEYLSVALSPDIDADINTKILAGIVLSPFEQVFHSCEIDIYSRRSIALSLIEDIYAQKDNSHFWLSDIEYSDIRFWDCIIPFPDTRRTPAEILSLETVFYSTQYAARIAQNPNNFLRFSEDQEKNVSVFALSWTSFEQVQGLTMDSTRIETSHNIEKSHWKNRIAYVHMNHYINPFRNARINWNQVWGHNYTWGWSFPMQVFNASHPLFIGGSDTELRRTLLPWTEVGPWIYKKILLQENTYNEYNLPRQIVGVTSYYAIVYNHDITPPFCENTFFSHDWFWYETFILPENPWFHSEKYMFFWCRDSESWCVCNSSMPWCLRREGRVLSAPQVIPHLWNVSYSFINGAWGTTECISNTDQYIRYDFLSPDIRIYQNSVELTWFTREYISNDGVLFDWNQIRSKRFFGIREVWEFQAGEVPEMQFQIYDPQIISASQESSWLHTLRATVLRLTWTNWQEIWVYQNNDIWANPSFDVWLSDINNWFDYNILEKSWKYQILLESEDRAGNSLRASWQYSVIPWPIHVGSSTIEITERNIYYANNSDTYEYQVSLRDQFWNRIPWREFEWVQQSCDGVVMNCYTLRTDMTQDIPTWNTTLHATPVWWSVSDEYGRIFFEVSSKSPGIFTERFSIDFLNPSVAHVFTGEENSFLKLVTWVFETYDDAWYDDRLYIWAHHPYRVLTTLTGATVSPSFELLWNIQARHPDTEFTLSWSIATHGAWIYFEWIFESHLQESESHKTLLEIAHNNSSWLIVSYQIWWETIRYRVSENHHTNDVLTLTDLRELDTPVRFIGWIQTSWAHHNVNERQNITDINTFLQRTNFRRNITQHIVSRSSHTDNWGIRYIDLTHATNKTYIPSPNPNYQTLIVRNGNILITENFNPTNQNIWLISYIDAWYNIDNWYSTIGNIYITPNVSRVNAFMYADWALVSTRNSWVPIDSHLLSRNNELPQQLTIKWVVFTRNTLAGWRELDWVYMLPWKRDSTNHNLAIQYDLYYLRRGNDWCARDSYDFCNIPQYLIIEYDSRIVSNPPPIFTQ